ncbi:MAG: hypothetical protein IPL69_19915 [Saprospiraceae bacterium]|nr:hypothetical protein [Candidatus Brachybacter algidus]
MAAEINSSDQKNRISFLGEWNPIPEEVIHQVDEVTFVRDSVAYTISNPGDNGGMIHMGSDEMIPFERLYVKVANVAGTKVNVTAVNSEIHLVSGVIITSHRNFTSTKGNQLVNGFALKKIDLGVKLDGGERRLGVGRSDHAWQTFPHISTQQGGY